MHKMMPLDNSLWDFTFAIPGSCSTFHMQTNYCTLLGIYHSSAMVLNLLTSLDAHLIITGTWGPRMNHYWNLGTPTELLLEAEDPGLSIFG